MNSAPLNGEAKAQREVESEDWRAGDQGDREREHPAQFSNALSAGAGAFYCALPGGFHLSACATYFSPHERHTTEFGEHLPALLCRRARSFGGCAQVAQPAHLLSHGNSQPDPSGDPDCKQKIDREQCASTGQQHPWRSHDDQLPGSLGIEAVAVRVLPNKPRGRRRLSVLDVIVQLRSSPGSTVAVSPTLTPNERPLSLRSLRCVNRQMVARLRSALGGRARMQVILLFACVLGLNTADLSSLGAIAGQLKLTLHIDNTQLGALAAAPSLIAAVFTLPFGILADRVRRVPLLTVTIALWAAAMVVCGAASSFAMLLFARLALGAVTAAAGPLIASLVGDLFVAEERGRIYGYIVAGELFGSLVGLLVAGNLAALSWRVALWFLVLPSIALSALIHRTMTEPARGGASRLRGGEETIPLGTTAAQKATAARERVGSEGPGNSTVLAEARLSTAAQRALGKLGVRPRPELVLERDPSTMRLWQALRYVLRIRTNNLLILSSALGYFFQAGVNTFGVVFLAAQFRLAQSEATSLLALVAIGALAGTLLGGRLSDALLENGRISARLLVGGGCFLISAVFFVPGLLSHSLVLSMALYFLAAAALAAPNGALDAARLDIVPGRLRGRAEAIRTSLRTIAVALSPLAFGLVSDALASGHRTFTKGVAYSVSAVGLKYTFLLMLIPMAIGGAILLWGRRDYARDVATAIASEAAIDVARRSTTRN